jgi:hypothetical protein
MLEEFRERQSSNDTEAVAAAGKNELHLILEVADILDELNMLLLLLEKQSSVLVSLQETLRKMKPADSPSTLSGLYESQLHRTKADTITTVHPIERAMQFGLPDVTAREVHIISDSSEKETTNGVTIAGQAEVWIQEAARSLQIETANIERLRNEAKRRHRRVRNTPLHCTKSSSDAERLTDHGTARSGAESRQSVCSPRSDRTNSCSR